MASSQSPINYRLPQIEQLLQTNQLQTYLASLSRPVVKSLIQTELQTIRQSDQFKQHGCEGIDVIGRIIKSCYAAQRKKLQRVINATGTVIHTNLGRSPIDAEIWDSVRDINTGYNNLELQVESGKRGGRKGLICELLHALTGAEDGLIVNNNASSVYLLLQELAKGKEVIISRGEQIQIGGGFRIPDIMALTGAKMIEVGTTNITTADDYINAITEDTALVLMVHQSNFAIQGFTEAPDINEVAKRLPDHIILAVDQGSGLINETLSQQETSVSQYLKWGVDLVCFSGDKILGGPQSGLICGRGDLVAQLEKNPMMRTFRPSRIVYSLLEALLIKKLNHQSSGQGIAQKTVDNHQQTLARAQALVARFPQYLTFKSLPLIIGGGTLPNTQYESCGVVIQVDGQSAQTISRALRRCPTPIITTIQNDQVLCHLATVNDDDFLVLQQQLADYFN
ncbi:L-seryl-tRNA(Sec) selenium transferase [Vibrio sp. S11_S32]|uniref:L-seryl-tRNA(Sec) selenium transferase n=1 Tax=Vibrio sp. S11_S32 TaxID=2720225 RepID=UPI00168091EE|nr:L-seryl-tRNA(Sec) selenium transferase [Vibrio sp. S11_S32]MBD1577982.1 L-seryl-tRNA(Sec) selenium transferase [Vibrio sp. S11_S32]